MHNHTKTRSGLPLRISPRLGAGHLLAVATILLIHLSVSVPGQCTSLVHVALVTCLVPLTLHAMGGTKNRRV